MKWSEMQRFNHRNLFTIQFHIFNFFWILVLQNFLSYQLSFFFSWELYTLKFDNLQGNRINGMNH